MCVCVCVCLWGVVVPVVLVTWLMMLYSFTLQESFMECAYLFDDDGSQVFTRTHTPHTVAMVMTMATVDYLTMLRKVVMVVSPEHSCVLAGERRESYDGLTVD